MLTKSTQATAASSPLNVRHVQNFDALRLGAASSVIFSHAFYIADGHERNEPLVRLLGGRNILGIYAVFTFLIISGFLVSNSLASSSLSRFFWKRFLRIFPGLVMCALVSAFVVSPLFSNPQNPWSMSGAFSYIAAVASLQIPGPLTTFYQDPNHLGEVFNGSLWTIPQEVYCYVMIAVIFSFRLFALSKSVIIFILSLFLFQIGVYTNWSAYPVWSVNFIYVLPSFAAGMTMYFFHARFGVSRALSFFCVASLIVSAFFGLSGLFFPVFGSYLILHVAFSQTIKLPNATKFGDLSYGTYLYGWPIEQIVRSKLGESVTWWKIFIVSLPLALFAGWLSWHLVEKRALSLKKIDAHVVLGGFRRRFCQKLSFLLVTKSDD